MRIKKDRSNQILELLSAERKVDVARLSEELGVSQVTVRKDLNELEKNGIIKREHGYAVLLNMEDMGTRIAIHYDAKRKIAQKACELVHDGDTIMIESGSCCTLLADCLSEKYNVLTIITNSAYVASYIRGRANFQIILLGGIYQQSSQVMVGPMVRQMAENFSVDLFFIGTDGYSPKTGFTNSDQLRAEAVEYMARQAEAVIVLTESEKFQKHGVIPLNLGDRIKTVITDSHIPEDICESLASENINIIKADL